MTRIALLLAAHVIAFDVASIRPAKADGITEFQIQANRLSIHGMSLKDLVRRAYLGSDAIQDQVRVTGGPAWVSTDTFDVTANLEGDPGFDSQGRPERVLAMLKTLLEDRFALKVHPDVREFSVYDLQLTSDVRRRAAALKKSSLECPVFAQGVPRPAPDPVRWCGVRAAATGPTVHVTAQGVTMAELASSMSRFRSIDGLVQDRTGLSDRFDFQFEFVSSGTLTNEGSAVPADRGPSLFTALQELGLKLQPATARVEVVVIDANRRVPN